MIVFESLSIGICAWVATAILFQPGYLLEWWWNILDNWHKELPKKYRWIVKPLGYCGFCFSGQLGLWFYLFAYPFCPAQNLIFAIQSIFFWAAFNGVDNLYKKYK